MAKDSNSDAAQRSDLVPQHKRMAMGETPNKSKKTSK